MPHSKEINVLLVDDDREDYLLTKDILEDIPEQKFNLSWISNYEEARKAVYDKKYDVFLVDFRLGSHNGLDLIRERCSNVCDAPFILLTGQDDREIDEEAMRAGAADYLIKGNIDSLQLERAIRYSMEHSKNLRQIRKLNSDLEQRVKQRTLILEEALSELEKSREELHRALEKEKELNEMKSRFVTMASHEFRTPLSTILSSVSLIAKYNEPGTTQKRMKHVERIKSAVNNLTDILNDFLSLGRLEEGKIEAHPEIFNLENLTAEICQEMQSVAKPGQNVKYKHLEGGKMAFLDKQLYRNILHNLISNAIKYSPEGKPIYITTFSGDGEIRISVKDKGIGISASDQKHLFERFFRGQNAINLEGTGLGLNILNKYTELMNGEVKVTSTLNEGSEFIVTFPNQTS